MRQTPLHAIRNKLRLKIKHMPNLGKQRVRVTPQFGAAGEAEAVVLRVGCYQRFAVEGAARDTAHGLLLCGGEVRVKIGQRKAKSQREQAK